MQHLEKKDKIIFLLNAAISLVVGLQHLIVPRVWGNLAGIDMTETGTFRLIGAALIALGIGALLAYNAERWETIKILAVVELIWSGLGTLVIIWAILYENLPPLEWLNAAILTIFAIAFSYLIMKYNRF